MAGAGDPGIPLALSRRQFLRITAVVGGGLLVSCGSSSPLDGTLDVPSDSGAGTGGGTQLSPFLRIDADNTVTFLIGATEMGQGILTGLAMVLAEELDADWSKVRAEHSPVAAAYGNPYFGATVQGTLGSTAVRGYYTPHRQVGARVRRLLIETAAARWQVDPDALTAQDSFVVDPATARRVSYGELASDAAQRSLPASAPLKDPAQFRLIGTPRRRLDGAEQVNGTRRYGMDFEIPGMLTVVVARPPRFFGQVLSYDDSAALAVPGVREVHRTLIGVAVVADNYWAAEQGRKALSVTWSDAVAGRTDSVLQRALYETLLDSPGLVHRNDGEVTTAQLLAAETLEADYFFPFQAHAAMEPLNVTIDYDGSRAKIWTGTQSPTADKNFACAVLGLPPGKVEFTTLPCGGGFGRRGNFLADFVRDACEVARVVRKPLKLVWSREDDMKGGYYRPMATARLSASLDNAGKISAWTHRNVVQDTTILNGGEHLLDTYLALSNGQPPAPLNDLTAFDKNFAYAVDNVRMDSRLDAQPRMPCLWMRGVNKVTDVFAQETFFDFVAHHKGSDPFELRRELLAAKPRHLAVLEAAGAAIGYGKAAGNRGRGIAVFSHWNSFVAHAAEVSVTDDKRVVLHRIVAAVDVGPVVNPDLVRAQIESAVVYALSSLFYGEITLVDGVVQQTNFDDYRVLRMFEMPQVEVIILPSSSQIPGGVGELGMPCVAPAVANAILAATGEVIRELPLKNLGYSLAEQHAAAGGAT